MKIVLIFFRLFYQIKKIALRILHVILPIQTIGVHAIVINEKKQVLLIKPTYYKYWTLPGGGVKKGESIEQALSRELQEEVGIVIQESPQFLGIFCNPLHGGNDYPVVYVVNRFQQEFISSFEVQEFCWFDLENLPLDISPGVARRLKEYSHATKTSPFW